MWAILSMLLLLPAASDAVASITMEQYEAVYEQAMVLYGDKTAEAIPYLEQAWAMSKTFEPDETNILACYLNAAYTEVGNEEKADYYLNQALGRTLDNPDLYTTYAMELYWRGQTPKAIACLKEILAAYPENEAAQYTFQDIEAGTFPKPD
jgi:tetratricopeptide (TPR) repeat protein